MVITYAKDRAPTYEPLSEGAEISATTAYAIENASGSDFSYLIHAYKGD